MRVIGVAGNMRMGKDTLANYLCDELNQTATEQFWRRVGFADNVKKVFCENFGVDLQFVEEWKVKKEVPDNFCLPIRECLQYIGDGFRKIRDKIWIDKVFEDKNSSIILSDVRYPNEFIRVKQEGGINVLIGRPGYLNDDPNPSEALIRPYISWCLEHCEEPVVFLENVLDKPQGLENFHIFIKNDSTLEEFYSRITEYIVPYVKSKFK